ncbi:hypothetical protein FA95DRAFT_1567795 [Auriscalpium vulgare]|uniref:Uncharacterized protein n=1 Tax=Auriscalpium vulgare TaxID=40419 RepID=A0ACB8R388_9AGAM|nr:hypothetical protein FA95DRAFT_1567795 [Auriscalpium vulgare]
MRADKTEATTPKRSTATHLIRLRPAFLLSRSTIAHAQSRAPPRPRPPRPDKTSSRHRPFWKPVHCPPVPAICPYPATRPRPPAEPPA